MRRNQQRLLGLGISVLGVLTWSPVLLGQVSPDSGAAVPALTDWSHHHVIFSGPANAEQTARVKRDPRYRQQFARQRRASLPEVLGTWASEGPLGESASLFDTNKIIGDWSQDLGSGGTVGATNYPAKFSFDLASANCASATQPDFVVYSTGLYGVAGQADVVAFDNLYSGCSGTVPQVYWAYDNGFTINTSPVLSRDGKQVAFVGRVGGYGTLILVKWAASTTDTITNPTVLSSTPRLLYPACIAPCMATIILKAGGGVNEPDTSSSVFYDYANDTAYVGDDAGWLHKYTPVFNGVPTDIRTGGWPVQVNPGSPTALTSPVHDYVSGNVYVADAGGFLYRVDSSATVTISGQLDFSSAEGGAGIAQGPIVDSTAGLVYVFASSDGSGSCIGGTDCTAVYQLTTTFTAGDIGSEAVVGASTISGNPPSPLYIGTFDSTYENSADPPTGNLYVCGNTGGPPILYQVGIQSGAMNGLGTAGPVLSNSTTPCSPVSDVLNPNVAGGTTEWVFASVETGGASAGCGAGGCIFNFKDTPWKPRTAYTVGQEVLDNHFQIQVVSVAGTSGNVAPGWSTIIGHSTTDATVHWLNQGVQSAFALAAWQPSHLYALHSKILDNNKNVQFVTTAGTSGGSIPTFNTTAGGITSDGATVKWTNLGALGTAALAAAGGTSGIIVDNTVGSGTLPGASQVYFSTLSNQVCGTSGTGGCAVQASQPALQ
jgi:hypothetical protein